jgi:Na+/pantothenate symporter
MEGLDDMSDALASGYSTATFLGQLETLFGGFRSCLAYDTAQGDVIMKANTVLLEMISDI